MRSGDRVVASWLHPAEAITPPFVASINAVERHSRRLAGTIPIPAGANIVNARNAQARMFLQTDAQWLWIVDSDMGFSADTLDRLCEQAHDENRPIVGGLCFSLLTDPKTRIEHPAPTLYQLSDTPGVMWRMWDWPDGLVEVDATGAACLLVHRSVLERMSAVHDEPWPWFCETAMDGRPVSEDIVFCLRARQLGYPVVVDTTVDIDHYKLLPVNAAMYGGFRHGPAFRSVVGETAALPC